MPFSLAKYCTKSELARIGTQIQWIGACWNTDLTDSTDFHGFKDCRGTRYELRDTRYELRDTNYEIRARSAQARAMAADAPKLR